MAAGLPQVFGREELVGLINRSREPILLLTGDSGIGKSTVLQASGDAAIATVATTVRVGYRTGGLQQALTESLSSALSQILTARGEARELLGVIVETSRRLALDAAQDLPMVLGKELLNFARARLGPGVGDAISEYVSELKTTYDERLEARLAATTEPTALQALLGLAEEVVSSAPTGQVVLNLDRSESLSPEEVRALADLPGMMPPSLQIRIAFLAESDSERASIDMLVTAGCREVVVPPLGREALYDWVFATGQSTVNLDLLLAATDGYPLLIASELTTSTVGTDGLDVSIDERFRRSTERIWRALDPSIARVANLLCAFPDAPPVSVILSVARLDEATWYEFRRRLLLSRIFVDSYEQGAWFHERRRLSIWHDLLTEAERLAAAQVAVEELAESASDGNAQALMAIASLVVYLEDTYEGQLGHVLHLSRDALSILSALLELHEPNSQSPAVEGNTLLDYARQVFGVGGNLLDALTELQRLELVVIASDPRVAVVLPRLVDRLIVFTVAGRAARELGKLPVPRSASSVFWGAVAPKIVGFQNAVTGIGSPTLGDLGERAIELRKSEDLADNDGTYVFPTKHGQNLLLRGSYAGRDMWSAVTFSSRSDRDRAKEALAGFTTELLGQYVNVAWTQEHPAELLPSRRVVSAFTSLVPGLRVSSRGSLATSHRDLERRLTPRRRAEVFVELAAALRTLFSEAEARAAGLEQLIGMAVAEVDDTRLEAEVLGRSEAWEIGLPASPWSQDPYFRFRLASSLNLGPGERVGRITVSGNQLNRDPAYELVKRVVAETVRYNKNQPRRVLELEADALSAELTTALRRLRADTLAMADAVEESVDADAAGLWALSVTLTMGAPDRAFVTGAESSIDAIKYPVATDSEVEAEVRVVPTDVARTPSRDEWLQAIRRRKLGNRHASGVSGSVSHILSDFLGYDEDELRFVRASEYSS